MTRKVRQAFRHEIIAKEIIADIRSGVYPVGTQLPPELELCKAFEASRHTVRQALGTLTDRGLIVRRASSGSMIISAHEPRILVNATESMAPSLTGPTSLRRTIVSAEPIITDADTAQIIQCDIGEAWLRLKTINHSEETGALSSAAEIYIPVAYAGILGHPDHVRMRISDQILSMYDEVIESVQVEVRAGCLGPVGAALLELDRESHGLAVTRRYTGRSDKLFEVSVTYHAENMNIFLIELRSQNLVGRASP